MEKFITATGKTIDLAIAAALEQLRMDRDSVSVEVLDNPKSGFLGIGAQPARVKVTYEAPDEAPKPALSSASRSPPSPSPRTAQRSSRPQRRRSSPPPRPKRPARPRPAPLPPRHPSSPGRTAAAKTAARSLSAATPSPASSRPKSPQPRQSRRSTLPRSPARLKSASRPSSRAFWSTWAPTPCRTP